MTTMRATPITPTNWNRQGQRPGFTFCHHDFSPQIAAARRKLVAAQEKAAPRVVQAPPPPPPPPPVPPVVVSPSIPHAELFDRLLQHTGIDPETFLTSRRAENVRPRWVIWAILRAHQHGGLACSYPDIATITHHRNHSTIISAVSEWAERHEWIEQSRAICLAMGLADTADRVRQLADEWKIKNDVRLSRQEWWR